MATSAPASSSLDVTLVLAAAEVISGGSVPATVRVHNPGATGQIVHSPEADLQFIFLVEGDNGTKLELSRQLYLQHTLRNPPPPREQEITALRGGATIEYPVDLAKLMIAPLKPGRYAITVVYPNRGAIYRSVPVTLRVVAPRSGLLEVAPSGDRLSIGTVMTRADVSGSPTLYQRESERGKPPLGRFQPRRSLREPTSVAISTDAEGATEARWIGWTEDGAAGFLQVWGDATLQTIEPTQVGADARLVSPGWTRDDGSVTFLAASPSALHLITMERREPPQVRTLAVVGGTVDPESIKAALFKNSQEPEAERFLAVWADGGILMASLFDAGTESAAAREVTRRPEPLVALDIERVGRERTPIIYAVFAAAGAGQQAYLMRIQPGGEAQTVEIPPAPESAPGARHWVVVAGPEPAAALQIGTKRILAWRPRAGWSVVRDSVEGDVSDLRLVQLGEVWAVWADSSDGIHYRELAE